MKMRPHGQRHVSSDSAHFEDHEDPAKKRHLFRTWHREHGRRSYDGQ